MDGWIGLSGCGKWMWKVDVDVESGAVPDLTLHSFKMVKIYLHTNFR